MKVALVFIFVLAATVSAHGVTIEWVTIGNPGNLPDTRYSTTGYGSVANAYQIGKYEVTAGQYTEFLNAVADDDLYGLYNQNMGDPVNALGANIQQTGSSPSYIYSVAADWANRPVTYVSFWEAARFANWLHNGQPTGPQGPGTTEDGAYHDIGNRTLFGRNAAARYFIPTEDEWYKAAYHDKTAGLAAGYFDYATGTDALPGRDVNEATNPGNNANYYDDGFLIGSPYYRTVVGEFELSDSPYGTFDQGGNATEWNETRVTSPSRGLRGGSFDSTPFALPASDRNDEVPGSEIYYVGFRVASVPLPSDYNNNSVVDAADYVLWRSGTATQAGYELWRSHFGETPPAGAGGATNIAGVPEPSSALLAVSIFALLASRRRAVC